MVNHIIEDKYKVSTKGSKGYAVKYVKDGKWYKVSVGAFNAHAEVAVSRLLDHSDVDHVIYDICRVNGEFASVSDDFAYGGKFVSINSMHTTAYGRNLDGVLINMDGEDAIKYVIRFIETELGDLSFKYRLSELLMVDACVYNEDRHLDNIGYIVKGNKYEFLKAFDFDAAFASCANGFSNTTIRQYKEAWPSLPFFRSHRDQVSCIEKLFGDRRIGLRRFCVNDITKDMWDGNQNLGRTIIEGCLTDVRRRLHP
jgi:hypothetical protein